MKFNRTMFQTSLNRLNINLAVLGITLLSIPTLSTAANPSAVFKEHKILDAGLNNMEAATVLYPENWKVEGGLNRNPPQYFSIPYLTDIKFTAPDGRQAHFYPSFGFQFNHNAPAQPFSPTSDGYMYMSLPASPGNWLMNMIQTNPAPGVQNPRFISEEQEPKTTQLLQQQSGQLYQIAQSLSQSGASYGMSVSFDTQATIVKVQYQQDGLDLEESFLILWQYMVNMMQGQPTQGTWGILEMRSFRGPVGSNYINDPQLAAITQSIRVNPAWEQEMNKFWQELARIKNQGQTQMREQAWAAHQKRMQTMSETSDIISQGWKNSQASQDRSRQQFVDSIHEVTPYSTPSGETVRLPSYYDNVYTDGNGRYILNNDAFYNPNQDNSVNNVDWQQINKQ